MKEASEEERRKKMSGIMAFMQPKGPQSKYNNVILGSFKLMQLVLSLVCTVLHIYSYMNQALEMPHVTIFCGTYAGYVIVSAGMFIGYMVRYRATPEMDLYYCFVGGLLYNIAGIVSMHIAQVFGYAQDSEGHVSVNIGFLLRCAAHSVLSTITGMLYWIDFFINLDIWWGVRRRHKRKLHLMIIDIGSDTQQEKRRTAITEEDELELHCVCLELAQDMKLLFKRLLQRETYERIFRSRGSDPEYDIEEFLKMAAEDFTRGSNIWSDMDNFRDSSIGRFHGIGGTNSLHRSEMLRARTAS